MGSKATGPGSGLSLAKGAVEAIGGHLTLERSGAGGSTFRITLPKYSRGPGLAGRVRETSLEIASLTSRLDPASAAGRAELFLGRVEVSLEVSVRRHAPDPARSKLRTSS